MSAIRTCAVHGTPLFPREDPARDTSGLFCSSHFTGEKFGHQCLVWNVKIGRRIVATGSFHPNQAGQHIWYDPHYLADAKRHILDVIEADEAPEREIRVRQVARVSESSIEDWS